MRHVILGAALYLTSDVLGGARRYLSSQGASEKVNTNLLCKGTVNKNVIQSMLNAAGWTEQAHLSARKSMASGVGEACACRPPHAAFSS